MKQFFNNKQKKKENKKQYLVEKRRETTQQADIEHKQSQLLLQRQDLSHRAQKPQVILRTLKDKREEHLDHMMEEYKKGLGRRLHSLHEHDQLRRQWQQPRPRPEQQQQTTLPPESVRSTADIMAGHPSQEARATAENNVIGHHHHHHHHHHIVKEMKEEEKKHQKGG